MPLAACVSVATFLVGAGISIVAGAPVVAAFATAFVASAGVLILTGIALALGARGHLTVFLTVAALALGLRIAMRLFSYFVSSYSSQVGSTKLWVDGIPTWAGLGYEFFLIGGFLGLVSMGFALCWLVGVYRRG